MTDVPSGEPVGIHGSSRDNVWIAGSTTVMQWDGARWIEHGPFDGVPTIRAIWTGGPNETWVAGSGPSSVLRWNGVQWATALEGDSVVAMAGNSADDLFLLAAQEQDGVLIHFDGVQFSRSVLPGKARTWGPVSVDEGRVRIIRDHILLEEDLDGWQQSIYGFERSDPWARGIWSGETGTWVYVNGRVVRRALPASPDL